MEFFDKFHALCFGFLVLIIVITVPYTINESTEKIGLLLLMK